MKKTVLKKLRSNDGASLMLALLFFVVCAVIGSIILTAATVASGRMTGIKKNNEELYTLRSASKVFKEQWTLGELYLHRDDSNIVHSLDQDAGLEETQQLPYTFLSARDLMAKEIYTNNETSSSSKTFFLKVNGYSDISEVKAVATMQPDYSVEISFTIEGDDASSSNYVTLHFDANKTEKTVANVNKTAIIWSNPRLYIGGSLK